MSSQKGVIGLSRSSIISDLPTPFIDPMDYHCIGLNQNEIDRCREACILVEPCLPSPAAGSQRCGERPLGDYLVEFPPDEEEDADKIPNAIPMEVERNLSVALSKALVIKRPRESSIQDDCEDEFQAEWNQAKRHRKGSQLLLMAEEAGYAMPPTSP